MFMQKLIATCCLLLAANLALATNLDSAWAKFYEHRDAREYVQALIAADALVTATAPLGTRSLEHGKALAERGMTQLLLGNTRAALADLEQADAIYADALPIYSEELIAALSYMGAALQSLGRSEDAMVALIRAQHITHRLWGTDNREQIPIVKALAAFQQTQGDLSQAESLMRFAVKLAHTHYGENKPEGIAATAELGAWLRSTGQYHEAISELNSALDKLQPGDSDSVLAYPLIKGLAHAYQGGYRGRFARSMFERMLKLQDENPQQFSLDQRIGAHLQFGDWLMQRYFESAAVEQYTAAWRLADMAGPDGAQWKRQLASPSLVRYGEMSPNKMSAENRFVDFRFVIRDDGRPAQVEITNHKASVRQRSESLKAFRDEIRFRPAIVDGIAMEQTDVDQKMYMLPDGVLIEPEPIDAPARLTNAVGKDPVETFELQRLHQVEIVRADTGG